MNGSFNPASGCPNCGHNCGIPCSNTDIAQTSICPPTVDFCPLEKTRAYHHSYCDGKEIGEILNQHAEKARFESMEHWEAFVNFCTPDKGIRAHFTMLIGCLSAHRARLSQCRNPPPESYLVCWALIHMGSPMSDFVGWSLAREEGTQQYWTIDVLEEHLLLWISIFESGPAKRYEENVIRLTSSLHPNQSATNGPSIAHAFSSHLKHRRWAHQLWKVFWNKHFQYMAKAHQPEDAEMTDAP
ncbi:uncharacterized protein Z519_03309 [Cladophialophora bantiana CBS 173.52]|uniref:Uncharacterized protein n=1 Tax=Cladophialophora bantiana (strain ATCC 10958 / CBS 173.52 / CDC B-1940 / NIH 8579) TaxID=1442370 RepID=A0A0D2F1Z8_CLAB1|nr:uncharacterized protein Z519_03309 [Cladophialophora bantiana CBS 173.52]KIW96241.1 hypothetical protein Z519_03309 [Cladophialophora bantiana CBS 173.52]